MIWLYALVLLVVVALAVVARRRDAEYEALHMLSLNGGWCYGLDLVRWSEDTGGRLKRGTVYAVLHRLVERGLVEERDECLVQPVARLEGQLVRRMFRITEQWQASQGGGR